jgi:hypothetical protein
LEDTVNTATPGFSYILSLKVFINLKNENSRSFIMKYLKICPKCHSNLKLHSDGRTQYCSVCKYWTKIGTARLDSIMIYG